MAKRRESSQAALDTYRLLGCEGFARVDVILCEDTGEPMVLEANAIPGLTETSLLPQAADAAGIGLEELVEPDRRARTVALEGG